VCVMNAVGQSDALFLSFYASVNGFSNSIPVVDRVDLNGKALWRGDGGYDMGEGHWLAARAGGGGGGGERRQQTAARTEETAQHMATGNTTNLHPSTNQDYRDQWGQVLPDGDRVYTTNTIAYDWESVYVRSLNTSARYFWTVNTGASTFGKKGIASDLVGAIA